MASDIGYTMPLLDICTMCADELDKSGGDLDKIWILGLRGLTTIRQQFAAEPITVQLPVAGNKTVQFPANCLSWSKIGVQDSNGQINALRVNKALTTFRDTNPNRLADLVPQINTDVSVGNPVYFNNYYDGGNCYQLYGTGSGMITYGECRVDEENRVIILPPDFQFDHILLEFIESPQKTNDYQVRSILQEPIIAFIKWKLGKGTRQDFFAECVAARRSMGGKKVILQSLNQVIRDSSGMTMKS